MVDNPLLRLQAAARTASAYVARQPAARVTVLDERGRVLVDVVVPAGEVTAEPPPAPTGWHVTERSAAFDGEPVPVSMSRLKLLKAFVEADGPLTAKELTGLVFDKFTDENNTRYHIRELKKELAKAFPEFEGCVVAGDSDGYRLILR